MDFFEDDKRWPIVLRDALILGGAVFSMCVAIVSQGYAGTIQAIMLGVLFQLAKIYDRIQNVAEGTYVVSPPPRPQSTTSNGGSSRASR